MILADNEDVEYALDILFYLESKDWEIYYNEIKQLLINSLLKLNQNTSLKQSLLKLLSKVCIYEVFMNSDNFPNLAYKVITENNSEKNANILIKNSLVLANLCANLKNFDVFTMEQHQGILVLSLEYCNSNKEKIISNGYRALGYYISNNSDEILNATLVQKDVKTNYIKRNLMEIYKKPFNQLSVKVNKYLNCCRLIFYRYAGMSVYHYPICSRALNRTLCESISMRVCLQMLVKSLRLRIISKLRFTV